MIIDFFNKSSGIRCLLFAIRHRFKGSPLKPGLQTQIALWLITRHKAFGAHKFKQGSEHF